MDITTVILAGVIVILVQCFFSFKGYQKLVRNTLIKDTIAEVNKAGVFLNETINVVLNRKGLGHLNRGAGRIVQNIFSKNHYATGLYLKNVCYDIICLDLFLYEYTILDASPERTRVLQSVKRMVISLVFSILSLEEEPSFCQLLKICCEIREKSASFYLAAKEIDNFLQTPLELKKREI